MRLWAVGTALIPILLATVALSQETSKSSAAAGATTYDAQSNRAAATNTATKDDTNSGHKYNLRLGLGVTAGYVSGPFWSPYLPYAYYPYYGLAGWDPFWGPFGPYYPADLTYGNGKGQIELRADLKNAGVYINGAYAGTTQQLKQFWLDPGAYDLSVSATGREPFEQRVYVLTGKTLSIHAKLPQHGLPRGNKPEEQP